MRSHKFLILSQILLSSTLWLGCDEGESKQSTSAPVLSGTNSVERVCQFGIELHISYSGRALDRPDLSGSVTAIHAPTNLNITDSFGVQTNAREFTVPLFHEGSKRVEGGLPEASNLKISLYEHHMGLVRAEKEPLLTDYEIPLREVLGDSSTGLPNRVNVRVECK